MVQTLELSWQSLAAMVSVSSVIVSVAVVYLRLFVENRLNELRTGLTTEIHRSSAESFLGKHVGEIVDMKIAELSRRVARMENGDAD